MSRSLVVRISIDVADDPDAFSMLGAKGVHAALCRAFPLCPMSAIVVEEVVTLEGDYVDPTKKPYTPPQLRELAPEDLTPEQRAWFDSRKAAYRAAADEELPTASQKPMRCLKPRCPTCGNEMARIEGETDEIKGGLR